MFRHDVGDGITLCFLFQLAVDPLAFNSIKYGFDTRLVRHQWAVVEIRRVVNVARCPTDVLLHIEHALGNDSALAGVCNARVLNGVLQIEQHAGLGALIAFIYQHGAAFQQVAVTLQREVDDGIEERMTWTDEGCQRLALRCYQGFLKDDALVARQNGLANTDEPIPVAHGCRDVGDLKAAGFSLLGDAAEPLEGFVKERFDVMGLQAARIGAFHVFADALHLADIHRIMGEYAFFE